MMMNYLYKFMYTTWNVLYTNIYFFFKEMYDFIDYVTYIQFNHLYEDDVEDDPVTQLVVKPKIEYEDKYKSELLKYSGFLRKNTDNIVPETWTYLTHNILLENTPLGNVILHYEPNKDSFCYYSDRILPYKYIDTVCRKYVIKFNCVPLYFDITNTTDNFGSKPTSTLPSTTTTSTTNKDISMNTTISDKTDNNIFVKLKSYNKSNKPYGNSSASSSAVNNVNWSYLDFKKTASQANTN